MRARDLAYLLASMVLSRLLIHRDWVLKALSVFTFESSSVPPQTDDLRSWAKKRGLLLFLGTIVVCLGVNVALSATRGTLFPTASDDVYSLLKDWPNIVNYALLCPIYVSLGLYFLTRVGGIRLSLRRSPLFSAKDAWLPELPASRSRKILVSAFIIAVGVALMSRYGSELTQYGQRFWFEPVPGEAVSLQLWYYMALNTALMVLVCWLVAGHFELFAMSCHVGRHLQDGLEAPHSLQDAWFDLHSIRAALQPYTRLYVISKVLVLVFVANMYTWKAQQPGFVGLLDLSIILLAASGAIVVSFPRYHIQSWLYRLWNASDGDPRAAAVAGQYPDIRTPVAAGIAGAVDVAILGGAMTKLVAFVLGRIDIQSLVQ